MRYMALFNQNIEYFPVGATALGRGPRRQQKPGD